MKTARKAAVFLVIAGMLLNMASALVYGESLLKTGIDINSGTALASGVFYSSEESARQSENYIEYKPGGAVLPIVAYGRQLYGRASLDYVTDYLTDKGYEVTAGINADFFELSSGISQGVVIQDGKIIASDNSKYAVGFYEDGSAIIGKPDIEIVAIIGGKEFVGLHINKELTTSMGFGLYTRDYAETTKTTIASINVIIESDSTEFHIGDVLSGIVRAVTDSSGELTIPEGCIVMSIASNSNYATAIESVRQIGVGDNVSITVGGNPNWREVAYGVGGGAMLVQGGIAQTQDSSSVSKDITARSAVGIKSDGTVVFYTVDGKQEDISKGINLNDLAERMEEMGCVSAINLDGGGSTTIAVKFPGDESLITVNSPSDGEQRKCANFIFLVNTAKPTGVAANLVIYPYSALILNGSTVTYDTNAVDSAWYHCDLPDTGVVYSSNMGTFSEGGVFEAETTGTGTVWAELDRLDGQTSVTVVDTVSSVSILYEELEYDITDRAIGVAPDSTLDLMAKASIDHLDALSSDSAFLWTVDGDIGAIDKNGLFTAVNTESDITGKVTVSYGDITAEVKITVSPSAVEGRAVEGYESGSILPVSDFGSMLVTRETNIENVKYGKSSLKLTYDFSLSDTAPTASVSQPISAGMTHIGLWVRGDGSDNKLAVNVGQSIIEICTLDFAGWKYFTAKLPEGALALTGYSILGTEGAAQSGSVLIDQLIEAKGPLYDITPPIVTAEIITTESGDTQLSATISDNASAGMKSEYIMLTYDGAYLDFTFEKNKISSVLPEADGNSHKITILASDSCGNLSLTSLSAGGDDESNPFADMSGHWAIDCTSYMYRTGVVSGMTQDGALVYKPDNNMTRAQFAVIIANWLELDLDAYAYVELPFDDNGDIPEWAVGAVKAVYSLGIVKGNSSGGALNYNPGSSLTRAEAMTIIGRTQVRGFAEASLDSFSDADNVPDWAAGYVKTLISQGVVSGSNGKINTSGSVTRAQVAKMLYTLM